MESGLSVSGPQINTREMLRQIYAGKQGGHNEKEQQETRKECDGIPDAHRAHDNDRFIRMLRSGAENGGRY